MDALRPPTRRDAIFGMTASAASLAFPSVLRAQASADDPGISDFQKRYPKAAARDFDGNAGKITEMDALVAYLQMLGTLVDFKLYEDKANLR